MEDSTTKEPDFCSHGFAKLGYLICKKCEEQRVIERLKKKFEENMGINKIKDGRCPLNNTNPIACWFCPFGHATDCHHPHICDEAKCGHYELDLQTKNEDKFYRNLRG